MPRKLSIFVLLALAAALGLSALSSAGGGKYPLNRSMTYRVGHPSTPSGATTSAIRGAHLRYYRTRIFPVAANGRDDKLHEVPRRQGDLGLLRQRRGDRAGQLLSPARP